MLDSVAYRSMIKIDCTRRYVACFFKLQLVWLLQNSNSFRSSAVSFRLALLILLLIIDNEASLAHSRNAPIQALLGVILNRVLQLIWSTLTVDLPMVVDKSISHVKSNRNGLFGKSFTPPYPYSNSLTGLILFHTNTHSFSGTPQCNVSFDGSHRKLSYCVLCPRTNIFRELIN